MIILIHSVLIQLVNIVSFTIINVDVRVVVVGIVDDYYFLLKYVQVYLHWVIYLLVYTLLMIMNNANDNNINININIMSNNNNQYKFYFIILLINKLQL